MKKEEFLKLYQSKSKNYKYKRYIGSPIRYPGGKSLAVGYIIELLPENINKVVSPFIGGGSVEIALSKELGIKIEAYDIFDLLVNFWNVILDPTKKEQFLNILYSIKPTKENYNLIKDKLTKHFNYIYKKEGNYTSLIKNEIELAAFYYFNYNLSYGSGFLGWNSSVYLNDKKYYKLLEKLQNFENSLLNVKLDSFENVLIKHKEDFLYLDPPYYLGEDSKMFKGIYPSKNIPIHHNNFNHELLAKLLKEHKGGFILSYNNCEIIRQFYKEFKQYFPKWQYTMGQGEKRIGKYREENNTNIKESHEILIYSPPKK